MKAGIMVVGVLFAIVGLVMAIYGSNEYNMYSGWAASIVYPNAANVYGAVMVIGIILCVSGFLATIYGSTATPENRSTACGRMYCYYCGAENPFGITFCSRCGKRLNQPPPT